MSCEGQVHLRRPTERDARGIAEVHVESWRAAYRDQLPAEFLDGLSVDARERGWRQMLQGADRRESPFWVAEAGGKTVGFVSSGPSRDDDADTRTAEIYAIYVHPECWEKGIGSTLLAHAVRDLRAHGYENATLWCLATNAQARKFYERAKWRDDGATKREQIGGTDTEEVRYRLPLAA